MPYREGEVGVGKWLVAEGEVPPLINMEDLVLSVPISDYGIIEALAARMGWSVRPRRTSIDRFIASCPTESKMTDEEMAAEVNAVRHGL